MESTCPDCEKVFSRKDIMLRHKRNKHPLNKVTQAYPPPQFPPPPPPPPPQFTSPPPQFTPPPPPPHVLQSHVLPPFNFVIPSNAVVVGPSGSGKTMFVFNILLNGLIMPTPNNIIWCYTEWQPLYTTIAKAMPHIQFVKGIPYNLQDEDYFDARNNNMLVLDDLMSEAKDDKRVSQLFTRTSHHKNVIIFLLLQNLFPRGKESRDIALNPHYVTLFNSPVDRQQVNIFAKRIYPNNPDRFMSVYNSAVQQPYGNLTIDLRPSTPENERLQSNVLDDTHKAKAAAIKGSSVQEVCQSTSVSSPVQTVPTSEEDLNVEEDYQFVSDSDPDLMMPSCDECGLMFENNHDLRRHVRTWCPDNGGEPLRKRAKVDTSESNNTHEAKPGMSQSNIGDALPVSNSDKEREMKGLEATWASTLKYCHKDILSKKEDYEDQGQSESWIERKLRKCWEETFLERLVTAMRYTSYFGYGPLFKPILDKVRSLDPETDKEVLSAKITMWMKPMVKHILSHVDLSEAEDYVSDQANEEQSDQETDTE